MAKKRKSAAERAFAQRMSDPSPFGIDPEPDDTTRVVLKGVDTYDALMAAREEKPRLSSFAFLDGKRPYAAVLRYGATATTLRIFDANGDFVAKSDLSA